MENFGMGNRFNPHAVRVILDKQNSKNTVCYDEDKNNDILLESNQLSKINNCLYEQSKKKVLIRENRKYNQMDKRLGRW